MPVHGDDADGWESLFNGKDLDGWSALIGKLPPGDYPPDHVEVRDGAIHMYPDLTDGEAVDFGSVIHSRTFSRFHLSLEYKWGKKRFAPRADALRDAGLLYHIQDSPRPANRVWPNSVECQIQEGDTGDIVMIGTDSLTWMSPEPEKAPEGQGNPGMLPEEGGLPYLTTMGRYIGRFPVADKMEGWNTVEIIVQADKSAVHKVNGVVRARLELMDDLNGEPIKAGKVGIQLEGAEILYRNIRIKELREPLEAASPYASISHVHGVSTGKAEVVVHNPGGKAMPLDLRISGKDSGSFSVESPVKSVEPGADVKLALQFKPIEKAGRYSAGLQIGPEDTGTHVVLQGLATDALEGKNEPPLQRIIHSLGIPVDVGGPALELGTKAAVIGDSKPARFFRSVGDGPVSLTPVARYSPPGNYPFGWQASGEEAPENVVGALADSKKVPDAHQRLFPPLADGGKSVEFSPGDGVFSLFVRAGKHTVGTDQSQHPNDLAHATRVYPVSVFQGMRVSNAMLVCFEEARNGDYQDCVFLMENGEIADAP